ncbi:hypothetical protein [Ekhidna sp. To15]|uniref:hypothetical protein n=1 Tax=Ekhidna sp. To15 TaxID=3395267 RepID=UPI003F5282D3
MEQEKEFKLLVAVTNHKLIAEAIALKMTFEPHVDTILIDNDSTFESERDKSAFTYTLEGAYYSGQINQAYEHMKDQYTHLLIINSDITFNSANELIDRIKEVYTENPEVGVYAPSAHYSPHNHMANFGTDGLRKVTFTDGFCYVIPKDFLDIMCPIDLSVNKIGHGVEIFLGFLGIKHNKWTVVDDFLLVNHPSGSGYSSKEARMQRDRWYETKSRAAQVFHYWVSKDILKNRFGYKFVKLLMKMYLPEKEQ